MRSPMRKVASTLISLTLAGGLIALGEAPAAAASCPSEAWPKTDGATAHWKLRCSGGDLSVYGWLEDTRRDGAQARVQVKTGGATHSEYASGKGTRENFSFKFSNRSSAKVSLSICRDCS